MKIFGLGTDIVNIKRIENLLSKNGDNFKEPEHHKDFIKYGEKSDYKSIK